jgi:hypothetical protein
LEYWNVGVLGFERIIPSFHYSTLYYVGARRLMVRQAHHERANIVDLVFEPFALSFVEGLLRV